MAGWKDNLEEEEWNVGGRRHKIVLSSEGSWIAQQILRTAKSCL